MSHMLEFSDTIDHGTGITGIEDMTAPHLSTNELGRIATYPCQDRFVERGEFEDLGRQDLLEGFVIVEVQEQVVSLQVFLYQKVALYRHSNHYIVELPFLQLSLEMRTHSTVAINEETVARTEFPRHFGDDLVQALPFADISGIKDGPAAGIDRVG